MFSPIATGIFSVRNAGRTSNGEVGRLPVAIGQSAALLRAGADSNSLFTGYSKQILNAVDTVAKSDKLFNYLSKAVKFASENVNPLIVCSSGLNVILAKDKQDALLTEGGCVAGMFLGEGLMKKHLVGALKKCDFGPKWTPVIKGIIFVAGSLTASYLGTKVGKAVAKQVKKYNNEYEKEQETKQVTQNEQIKSKTPKSVNLVS